VPGAEVDAIIKDRRVAAVTLTGSDPAGVSVATAAGSVLKKTVLELGGSDAFIVLDDADIEAAAQMAAKARFQNTGQSCIAAKRFIVVESVADAFESAFVQATEALKVGDPLDRETQVGAMARHDLRDDLDRQVRASLQEGAKTLTGGKAISGPGAFYAPTILTNVTPEMTVFKEETFGPVAAVIHAKDEADAIRLANQSDFGLGGAVWTRDIARGEHGLAPIIVLGPLKLLDVDLIYGDFNIFAVWKMRDRPAMILGMDVLGTVRSLGIDFRNRELYFEGAYLGTG